MSYYDDFVNHIIDTDFYAEKVSQDFKKRMEKLKRRLSAILDDYGYISSKTDYRNLVAECEEETDEILDDYFNEYNAERSEHASEERDWLKDFAKTALGVTLALVSLRTICSAPFNKTHTIKTFKDWLKGSIVNAVKVPATSSMIFGTSASTVKDAFISKFDRIEKGSMSDIKTDANSIQRTTQELMFINTDVKFIYNSMLDSKTCISCGDLSGKMFNSLENAPLLPLHDNCRCFYSPFEEETQNYAEWFESQDEDTKYKILGKSRYSLYKAGIPISRFTSEGRMLTLDELYKSFKNT